MTRALALACPERTATLAGEDAFAAGGNALDAALTAATTLAVTYPHMCGAGGDLFAVVRLPDGRVRSVNASGPAARAADAHEQRRRGPVMPLDGPDPITVPGAVAGWAHLHALGARRAWAETLAPAVALARDGFPITTSLADALAEARLDGLPSPPAGAPLRQPALARTLAAIAEHGARELYEGDTGERLAAGLQRAGSRIDAADLAGFAPEETAPLTAPFRGLTLHTSPPNSSGVLLLQALTELGDDDDPGTLATLLRKGMERRAALLADPRAVPFDPGSWLRDAAPGATGTPPSGDTVAIVAADDDGLAVSLIQSLFDSFGSRVREPETGIVLHNRGAWFSLAPGHPNELAGGKRPAHTLLPVVAERDGELAGVLGTMGGFAHAQFLAQVLLRILAGDGPQAAVAAPRWVVDGGTVAAEPGIEHAPFEDAGLRVAGLPPHTDDVGHVQAVWRTGDRLAAGTDPRADGAPA